MQTPNHNYYKGSDKISSSFSKEVANKGALNSLYKSMCLICYQLPNFLSDFENEFSNKDDLDRKILHSVKETIKSCMSVTFDSTELVHNLVNAEDDLDILDIIRVDDGRLD